MSTVYLLYFINRWVGFSYEWLRALSGLCDNDPAVTDGFLLWGKVWGCNFPWVHKGYTQITSQATKHWASVFPQDSLKNFDSQLRLFRTKQAQYTYTPSSLQTKLPYKKKGDTSRGQNSFKGRRASQCIQWPACLCTLSCRMSRELETPMSADPSAAEFYLHQVILLVPTLRSLLSITRWSLLTENAILFSL